MGRFVRWFFVCSKAWNTKVTRHRKACFRSKSGNPWKSTQEISSPRIDIYIYKHIHRYMYIYFFFQYIVQECVSESKLDLFFHQALRASKATTGPESLTKRSRLMVRPPASMQPTSCPSLAPASMVWLFFGGVRIGSILNCDELCVFFGTNVKRNGFSSTSSFQKKTKCKMEDMKVSNRYWAATNLTLGDQLHRLLCLRAPWLWECWRLQENC